MQIHVQRSSEALGVFTPEETTQQLAEGKLLETDLAWHEGLEDKIPKDGCSPKLVGKYDPNDAGFGEAFKQGLKPPFLPK